MKIDVISCAFNENYAEECNSCAIDRTGDWLVFLADGTQAQNDEIENTLSNLCSDIAIVEFCRYPIENGDHYNPVSLEKDSFDCRNFAVRKSVWDTTGGFDRNLPVWVCSADFSRRIKINGFKIKYCPWLKVISEENIDKRHQYIYTNYGKLLLNFKYGDKNQIKRAKNEFLSVVQKPQHFDGVRKELALLLAKSTVDALKFTSFRKKAKNLTEMWKLCNTALNLPQKGVYHVGELVDTPLVSVVVRTHERKDVLRETLHSLTNQTYKNFEVVVIEDGKETAREVVEEFSDLNINYYSTGENVGRGRAGNIGIEKSKGKYICFLDDDDYYAPDFISTFVYTFQQNEGVNLLISGGMAFENDVKSASPYIHSVENVFPVNFSHITLMDMCVKCRVVSVSSAMFEKSLYYDCGGMREDLDGDEDWAMWLKFLSKANRTSRYYRDIPRALSYYGIPADKNIAKQREDNYAVFDKTMLSDPDLKFAVHTDEIHRWEKIVSADIMHIKNIGQTEQFVKSLTPVAVEKLTYTDGETLVLTAKQINGYYHWLVSELTGIEIKEA